MINTLNKFLTKKKKFLFFKINQKNQKELYKKKIIVIIKFCKYIKLNKDFH